VTHVDLAFWFFVRQPFFQFFVKKKSLLSVLLGYWYAANSSTDVLMYLIHQYFSLLQNIACGITAATVSLVSFTKILRSASIPSSFRRGMANLNASIGGSASLSEYDEDDKVRRAKRKRVDKGKWKARHEEDAGHG
jgi:hypothetical protein